MLFDASITISRTPEQVWSVFSNPDSWSVWWGGMGLSSADWQEGGKLNWGVGGYSTIVEIIPARKIHYSLKGAFTKDTVYTFEPVNKGTATQVTVREDYEGVSGGSSKQQELKEELTRLKTLVESNA